VIPAEEGPNKVRIQEERWQNARERGRSKKKSERKEKIRYWT
jgi:hypothetical protein